MLTFLFGHFCAIAIGISLGLMGGGGSILAVPTLVYVLGVDAKGAIAISLGSVGVVSLIGTMLHWQKGNVRIDIVLMFAPAAMVGAYLGARLAGLPWISEGIQLFCFSLVMLLVSGLMILKGRRQRPAKKYPDNKYLNNRPQRNNLAQRDYGLEKANNIRETKRDRSLLYKLMVPTEGLGIGLLTGFVGIGGGFAIVPALVLLTKIPVKQAVGTSLLIITLNSVTGFLGYIGQTNIHWLLASTFTSVACLGILLGSYLNKVMSASTLQASFGYFVLAAAVLMLVAQSSF